MSRFYLSGLVRKSGNAFQTAWKALSEHFEMIDFASHDVYDNLFYAVVGVNRTKKILIVQIDKETGNFVHFTAMEEGLIDSAVYQHCPVRLLLQTTKPENYQAARYRQKCWDNSQMAVWVGNQIERLR